MNSSTRYFVDEGSVVRKIWGKSDTILFIFAGASAEFALNKAVDWLYFTGKLPADPLGRLFSTVAYARLIVFSELQQANDAIDKITSIHTAVETSRNARIPDWAYRDVLFMLIYYSVAAFELLERKLTEDEKSELYDVFYRMGLRMNLKELPKDYNEWLIKRNEHLRNDLEKSEHSADLYKQYRKHLGAYRYKLLLESQKLVVPDVVDEMLGFGGTHWLRLILPLYKLSRWFKMEALIKFLILPVKYRAQIKALDHPQQT